MYSPCALYQLPLRAPPCPLQARQGAQPACPAAQTLPCSQQQQQQQLPQKSCTYTPAPPPPHTYPGPHLPWGRSCAQSCRSSGPVREALASSTAQPSTAALSIPHELIASSTRKAKMPKLSSKLSSKLNENVLSIRIHRCMAPCIPGTQAQYSSQYSSHHSSHHGSHPVLLFTLCKVGASQHPATIPPPFRSAPVGSLAVCVSKPTTAGALMRACGPPALLPRVSCFPGVQSRLLLHRNRTTGFGGLSRVGSCRAGAKECSTRQAGRA